ncbi:unnamed protein product [Nyctereutes procyonoides]|uniref:(raccoon dog) hypothetical protein n=1 Tax=Nyctereutes procyonoides TaxID=34880 RepID=A0A811ZAZ2_NYCPR|nr:unnamed protein product [Nyctereutes procyonoides]
MAGVPGARMEWRRACAGRMRAAVGGAALRGLGRRSRFPAAVARGQRSSGALRVPRARTRVAQSAPVKSRPELAPAPRAGLQVEAPRCPPPRARCPATQPSQAPYTVDQALAPPRPGGQVGGPVCAARVGGGRGTRPGAARETPDPPSPPRTPELGQAPGLPGGRSPDPWPWGAVDGGRGAYTGVGADPSS